MGRQGDFLYDKNTLFKNSVKWSFMEKKNWSLLDQMMCIEGRVMTGGALYA